MRVGVHTPLTLLKVKAGEDVLPRDVGCVDTCIARVTIIPGAQSLWKAVFRSASAEVEALLNSGQLLAAGSVYVFDIPLARGERLNLRSDADQDAWIAVHVYYP